MTVADEVLDSRLKTLLSGGVSGDATKNPAQADAIGRIEVRRRGSGGVDQIWGGFCDLAMAGDPRTRARCSSRDAGRIDAAFDRYDEVSEICRGSGWSPTCGRRRHQGRAGSVSRVKRRMAGWLLRAIVDGERRGPAPRRDSRTAGRAAFRLDREIKNVITVIAKTCHYWLGHMPAQQRAIADLFAGWPGVAAHRTGRRDPDATTSRELAAPRPTLSARDTGLRPSTQRYPGWLGVECPSSGAAVWMMRALVVSNVLSRREGTVLFVPVNPEHPQTAGRACVTDAVVWRTHQCAAARGIG